MSVALSPEFKFVTEECLKEWKNPSTSGSYRVPDPVPMTRFLFELCWAMIKGELPSQKCKIALDSVSFLENEINGEDMGSILADIVAQFAQDLTISGDQRSRLVKMTKSLVDASLIPVRLLQERCEEEFLFEAEFSRMKAQDLKSREVRVNTRLLYQQTKFNLLREESEGYAKLITLLCQDGLDSGNNKSPIMTISIIKSLIGHFDLDPNRVFDIVLDCFELYPEKKIFYDLIPIFPKSHAAQILGFKFQYYQRMEVTDNVPSALFHIAALLVKENFIDLDSIYAHLLPKDEEAFKLYDAFLSKRIDEASKIGKINLAATGKDLMETEEKQDVTVDLYAALDTEIDALADRAPEIGTNQKLGLLIGFLSVHDWYHAHILFERLAHLNPVEHVPICEGLFRVIERTMQGAYKTYCNYENAPRKFANPDSNAMEENPSLVELSREFFQMLSVAGPYLHRDTKLLQKVCRVLRGYYTCTKDEKTLKELNEINKIKEIRVMDALSTCLLPSLQLIPANPAIGHEIWEVLSLLSYEVRYRLYGEWEKDDERNPTLLLARQIAKLDTRRILKRLAKENLKQLGRMVAKLAHANPMTVLRTIVQQIEAYRDMITPVVDAFKYLTQLEYDVLEYVVIERLAQEGRDKLKEDGINLSDWLQSLASFWGHLCKKYPSMELRGLFQYLVNKLQQGSGIELVLLEELIEQMANVHYTENMTEEQLDALAGSETLRYQSNSVGTTRNNKVLNKSTNRLRDSLIPKDDETKLAIPLLMLIAQHRSTVVIKNDAPYIKMVSEQFDRAHGMLLQYVEFLSSAVSPVSSYAQLIPSLHDLLQKYHLEPEVAFLIYRPIMRLFKSASDEGIFWPLDGGEEGSLEESSDFVLNLDSSVKTIRWSDLLNTIGSTILANSSNSFSPDMFATFWGLTLYDLYVPKKRYEAELSKQHSALKALEDLSDTSSVAISKRKKDKEKIQELLDRLTSEYNKHEKHVASVRHRLIREKDKFFLSSDKATLEFLQRCVFPRCVFSATDAVYCAEFVATLHSVGTPGFNTYGYLDVLICKLIQPVICCCTELEAARFGRFLCETLKLAYHWKKSESTYERECGNMPGFVGNSRSPNSQRVSFAQFVRAHHRWSGRITRMLAQCLESNEYMEIRNALIVLTKISSVFPVLRKSGVTLEKRVAKIKADEREDLKVLATSVAAALASRKSTWVSDEIFCMGYVDLKPATTASPKKASLGNSNHQAAADSSNNIPSKENHAKRPKSTGENKSEKLNGSASRLQDESQKVSPEENVSKPSKKPSSEPEARGQQKNRNTAGILGKPPQKDDAKLGKPPKVDDAKLGKPPKTDDAKLGKPSDSGIDPVSTNGTKSSHKSAGTAGTNLPKTESSKPSSEHTQKRAVQSEEQERVSKRRKGEERERENDNEDRERERDRGEEREREREKDKREKEKDRERERSSERKGERDRSLERERGKEERERESEMLPPPPPLPPSFTPLTVSRHSVEREREKEREKERVREREREREDDVGKRRRERDDRDGSSNKLEERERERTKDDNDANASKRRKMKRSTSTEPGEYSPVIPSHSSHDNNNARGERKGGDNVRAHTKDSSTTPSKASRRETEQSHERDYEEDNKRPRADTKRKHRK